MSDFIPDGSIIALSTPSEHGALHGQLTFTHNALGIIVLAHTSIALDEREEVLAGIFRHAGFSTFTVKLLAEQEEHFPDVHNNVPLLAKRLVDFLGLLKYRMLMGILPTQTLGLFAANDTTPVAVRVAALRDHDIAAIVCRSGLVDLAGMLYLRSLESPLLMLIEETDNQHLTSSRRALQEITCTTEIKEIPEIGFDYANSPGFEVASQAAVQWFQKHMKGGVSLSV